MNTRDDLREILRHGSGQWPDPELTDGVVEFVAQWIREYGPYDDDGEMEREWRRDMA